MADRFGTDVTVVFGLTPGNGVEITGAAATGNLLLSNQIGTNAAGTTTLGNHGDGVLIDGAAGQLHRDGDRRAKSNLISGNVGNGVTVENAAGNAIVGNGIGVQTSLFLPLGNGGDGVDLVDASNTIVGGTVLGSMNSISANGLDGVQISGSGSSGDTVIDNQIGNSVTNTPIPNQVNGVEIDNAPGNSPRSAATCCSKDTRNNYANDISGNPGRGVLIVGAGATGNQVLGNAIDHDVTGGVALVAASNNVIGAFSLSGLQQDISDDGSPNPPDNPPSLAVAGVLIEGPGASGNIVQDNNITENTGDGVALDGASANTIGGTGARVGDTTRATRSAATATTASASAPSPPRRLRPPRPRPTPISSRATWSSSTATMASRSA